MTQEEFFGAVEHNLKQLAKGRGELPSYNIPTIGIVSGWIGKLKWLTRVKRFAYVSKGDVSCPPNVRCYDLFSAKAPFVKCIMFRIFACYADESTREGYRKAKRAIRRWYQMCGRATSSEQPYAAAIVVGASSPWESGMTPNADDMPCDNVAFRMLAASHPQAEKGICTIKEGDVESCAAVCRALVPETFDMVERRVRNCVDSHFRPDGSVVGGINVFFSNFNFTFCNFYGHIKNRFYFKINSINFYITIKLVIFVLNIKIYFAVYILN